MRSPQMVFGPGEVDEVVIPQKARFKLDDAPSAWVSVSLNTLERTLNAAKAYARHHVASCRVAGERPVNVAKLERRLRETAIEINEILSHMCEFGDNDYCGVCGRDGRV